jgi:predicted lipase
MKDRIIDRSQFDGATSRYTNNNSLHMMKLSYAVYAGTVDIIGAEEDWSITEKLVKDAGYQMKRFENRQGVYEPNAMIVWDDENIFLVFRGTEPTAWNQWATDAKILRRPFCIGKIHRGFRNSVELIWPDIITCLKDVYIAKKRRLFVTGHSLGAGMSQVATSKLEFEEGLYPTAIYNFGCPRAFNCKGADLYNQRLDSRTYRVVNNNDIVCNLPFEGMGYSHVGQFKYITADGELRDDPDYWRLLLDGVWGKVKALGDLNIIDAVTDHLPQSYTEKLEMLSKRI